MKKRDVIVKIPVSPEQSPQATRTAMLVQVANRYDSKIYFEIDNKKINAKSIMGMMTLKLNEGESVTVTTEGDDEEAAVKGIEQYLSTRVK